MEFIFSVRGGLSRCQSGCLLYTRICSTSRTIPLESLRVEYVLCHEISATKQLVPNISSHTNLRLMHSVSSILMNIAPSSASSRCRSRRRTYIMQSHLSWRVRSSPSRPPTSPSHFLIFGSLTLSLYIQPSLPVLYGGSI